VSESDVLVLWLADPPDTRGRHEALRALVAARAAGRSVGLLDLRPTQATRAAHPAPDLSDDEQRLLEALAAEGVTACRPSADELRRALNAARALVVVADPQRQAAPGVLCIDAAWLRTMADAALLPALRRAGQLVRA